MLTATVLTLHSHPHWQTWPCCLWLSARCCWWMMSHVAAAARETPRPSWTRSRRQIGTSVLVCRCCRVWMQRCTAAAWRSRQATGAACPCSVSLSSHSFARTLMTSLQCSLMIYVRMTFCPYTITPHRQPTCARCNHVDPVP